MAGATHNEIIRLTPQRKCHFFCIWHSKWTVSNTHITSIIAFEQHWMYTHKRLCGVRSLCRRFLNQFDTCVNVSPVFLASNFFSSGVGYLNTNNKYTPHNIKLNELFALSFLRYFNTFDYGIAIHLSLIALHLNFQLQF